MPKYNDLEIVVEKVKGAKYSATVDLEIPITENFQIYSKEMKSFNETVKNFEKWWNIDKTEFEEDLKKIGGKLFSKIFKGKIRELYEKRRTKQSKIRLLLKAENLSHLPWEALYDEKNEEFVSLQKNTPIIRSAQISECKTIKKLEPPLKVLVIVSSPVTLTQLNVEEEKKKLKDALQKSDSPIFLEYLYPPTRENLQDKLKSEDYHIIHFTGHGSVEDSKGFLALEDENCDLYKLMADDFGSIVSKSSVKLVVLSACKTAEGSMSPKTLGVAQALIKNDVPAVVAMRFVVSDKQAINFARRFYYCLAKGDTIEDALTDARIAIHSDVKKGLDWIIPVLFTKAKKGNILSSIKGEIKWCGLKIKETDIPLNNIPSTKAVFVGREVKIIKVSRALGDIKKQIITITGLGGIGKSSLAEKVANRNSWKFEGGIRWIDCRGKPSLDVVLSEILKMFEKELNVEVDKIGTEQKTAFISQLLPRNDNLLIFDNFESVLDDESIRDLLKNLSDTSKVLITSRKEVGEEGEEIIHLDILPEKAGIELIIKEALRLKVDRIAKETRKRRFNFANEKDLKLIYVRVGGHPQAIKWVVSWARKLTLEQILKDLKPLHTDLNKLFDRSYDILEEEEKLLLRQLSIFLSDVSFEDIEALFIPTNIWVSIGTLIDANLLEFKDGRYILHPIVREYVYPKLENQKELHLKAGEYLLSKKGMNPLEAIDQYFFAEDWKRVMNIIENIYGKLVKIGLWNEAIKRATQGIEASRRIGDKEFESGSLLEMGIMYYRVGNYEKAKQLYHESIEKGMELKDKRIILGNLHQLGMIEETQGNYDEALKFYKESLKISEELENKSGIAKTIHQLGNIEYLQSNYDEALKYYNRSLKIKEEVEDKSGIASTLHQLGKIAQDHVNYNEALKYYNQSLNIKKELGDKIGIAFTLHQLGIIAADQGNYDKALKYCKDSLNIKKELGDRSGISTSFHLLGTILENQGNYSEALKYYKKCLKIAEELGEKGGITVSLHQLGIIAAKQGNYSDALKYCEGCLKIKMEIGDKKGIAYGLALTGLIKGEMGEIDKGIELTKQALEIFDEIGLTHEVKKARDQIDDLKTWKSKSNSKNKYFIGTI